MNWCETFSNPHTPADRALTAAGRALRGTILALALMVCPLGLAWSQTTAVPARQMACQKETVKIALDIGHDRTKPGATSARGVPEFEYNLSLARKAFQALREAGFHGVFLIGESGGPMPLLRRTQIAREQGAALFLSLHHDSAQKQYFSQWTVNGRSLPHSDTFHGYSVFVSTSSPWARDSMALATHLARELKARGLTPTPHHAEPIPGENRTLLNPALGIYRFDELAVLRTATMPALLLEAAVIVNREEEQAIQSGQYHPRVTAALVEALSRHCATMTARRDEGQPRHAYWTPRPE